MPLKKGHKGKRTISEMQADPDFCVREKGSENPKMSLYLTISQGFFKNFCRYLVRWIIDWLKKNAKGFEKPQVLISNWRINACISF